MAKKKSVDSEVKTGVLQDSAPLEVLPIKNAVPAGNQVLIEILTAQEMAGTSLMLTERADLKVPLQGFVRAAGPNCQCANWGFKIGDRVLISGSGVKAPNYDNSHRERYFMEPHSIKAVLVC